MRIIVLFNLKEGVDPAEYEAWAREKDIPTANALTGVDGFTVHKATGIFGDESATSPYQYFEVLDISDMDGFLGDVSKPDFQEKVAAVFGEYADNPTFIMTEDL